MRDFKETSLGQAFKSKPSITSTDISEATRVLSTGCLSDFFGSPGEHFNGGKEVRELENAWKDIDGCKHAVSVNSWTTGLVSCLKACGVGYGDEVICTPLTMSGTASAILECGAIPVFCDVDRQTLNISPERIREALTKKTKAIMVVHLFGLPADMDEIIEIAKDNSLFVIEDAAHAPLADYKGRRVGCIGDIGGFSLNYHKHIHCGEGGIIVSNSDILAERCRFIRNHGENALADSELLKGEYIVGCNYRLTEIQAAIARSQLKRLENCIHHRNKLHAYMVQRLSKYKEVLELPAVSNDRSHSFYCYPLMYNKEKIGIGRDEFVKAVNNQFQKGKSWDQQPLSAGYSQPLYMNPIYREPLISKAPFPIIKSYANYYARLKCREAEDAVNNRLVLVPVVHEGNQESDIERLCLAIDGVIVGSQ